MAKKKSKTVSYPWDKWMTEAALHNRGKFTLVERKDYRCMTCSMTRQVRKRAAYRGYPHAKVIVERGVERGRTRCDKIHVRLFFVTTD